MIRDEAAERWEHTVPESIEEEWGDEEVETEALHDAFLDEARELAALPDEETELVAVQGEISSGKTWLIAALAEELLSQGNSVTILAPQKQSREEVVSRLGEFGVPSAELPSHEDMCEWDEWSGSVDRVDENTCSSNGCEKYPNDKGVVRRRAEAVVEQNEDKGSPVPSGPVDGEDFSGLAERCPAYLGFEVARASRVCVATYAKALSGGSGSENPLSADVLLLDEGHSVAADPGILYEALDVTGTVEALRSIVGQIEDSAQVQRSRRCLSELADALEGWHSDSRKECLKPWELLNEVPDLSELEEAIEEVEKELLTWLRHSPGSGGFAGEREAYRRSREVKSCLGLLKGFKYGHRDFEHVRYERRGETVSSLAFRLVDDGSDGVGLDRVCEEWKESGTHPAISERWGGILASRIEECVAGRNLVPGGDREEPGEPPLPLEVLRDRLDADVTFTFSATHNELSDPTRSPEEPRSTRHDVVVGGPNLRSDGHRAEEYAGKLSADAETPWFRRMVEEAKDETGASLVAVPINKENGEKWRGLPVEDIGVPDGDGGTREVPFLVPNSRGAHGSKDLEKMPVDVALCGCQVQSPAETAKIVTDWWSMLAPHYDDPSETLSACWRLLAQRAVSPTLQAAGRFRGEATALLFEIQELVELAGFEHSEAEPEMCGFVGEFEQRFDEAERRYRRTKMRNGALGVVKALEEDESKSPTESQCLSVYKKRYDATKEEAAEAFTVALEEGAVEYVAAQRRFRLPPG
ncbi:MAG: hypothetical protein U5J64_06710 [Halobacteriales archaeon]|nr:hypothetical protein [Halobacteriales archaeon]